MSRYKYFTDQQTIDLINDYKSGLNFNQLAKKNKCHIDTIRNKLILSGINIPDKRYYKYYTVNSSFFDNIDTEEKAYILGFIYSDGYLNEKKNTITIDLSYLDYDIVYKIGYCFYGDEAFDKVKFYDRANENKGVFCIINITSQELVSKLKEFGCHQRKSLTITYPTVISDNLQRHFIRGYFDGDGGIFSTYATISICGSEMFISELRNRLINELNMYFGLRIGDCYSLILSGRRQIYKFLKWIYEDSNIYLERKYRDYLLIKEMLADINNKIKAGTQGFSKGILIKYGKEL
jgi:hypothetical protein